MNNLLKKLNIDETFTKKTKRDKVFTKISDVVTPIEGYNYMADLLYLPDDGGYKYLLVMTVADSLFLIGSISNACVITSVITSKYLYPSSSGKYNKSAM